MDRQRGTLLASSLVLLVAAAAVSALSRRPWPTRAGSLAGFCGIEIIPFLIHAASAPSTPGLRARPDIAGWITQPLGMLLLAAVAALVGAALGTGLARDAARLPRLVRRRWTWPLAPPLAALVVISALAAGTALEYGPQSALQDYGPARGAPVAAASPAATPGAAHPTEPTPEPTPDIAELRPLPGSTTAILVGGRQVDLYLPGIYTADPSIRLPVLYLLHGSPGDPEEWFGSGGQLQGVLDQMIAAGTIPPLIAVVPDGNGTNSQDTEWGDVANGDIESWLVGQVVPTIDGRYRTLAERADRGIAGLSSGGFGAVNIAFQHPTLFGWAGSFSGYFVALSGIFGSAWRANSPLYTASTVPQAERVPLYLGAGAEDYAFRADTAQFAATLRRLGWPSLDVQTVPGGHGWVAWRAELVQSLTWLGRLWGSAPWATPPAAAAG